jgi:hypothetical protein
MITQRPPTFDIDCSWRRFDGDPTPIVIVSTPTKGEQTFRIVGRKIIVRAVLGGQGAATATLEFRIIESRIPVNSFAFQAEDHEVHVQYVTDLSLTAGGPRSTVGLDALIRALASGDLRGRFAVGAVHAVLWATALDPTVEDSWLAKWFPKWRQWFIDIARRYEEQEEAGW